jgi:hypothetical protein
MAAARADNHGETPPLLHVAAHIVAKIKEKPQCHEPDADEAAQM